VSKLLARPGVAEEVARIDREEGQLLDQLLKARQEAGLTQAQVAQRMGTQAPSVARLERALATGKHSPVATLSARGRGPAGHADRQLSAAYRPDGPGAELREGRAAGDQRLTHQRKCQAASSAPGSGSKNSSPT
jgi:transcriptional regulator with XRE-family HTH domain